MGGPAYEPSRATARVFRFPSYYAGKPLFYEWSRDYIKEFRLNDKRRLRGIFPFTTFVDNPMDMEFGPDGALYVLEYGDGFFAENPDAQLSKINFVRGNRTPVVKVAATPAGGPRAADRHVLERGHERPGRRPICPTRGTSTPTARSTRARRIRRTPTRATARTARR